MIWKHQKNINLQQKKYIKILIFFKNIFEVKNKQTFLSCFPPKQKYENKRDFTVRILTVVLFHTLSPFFLPFICSCLLFKSAKLLRRWQFFSKEDFSYSYTRGALEHTLSHVCTQLLPPNKHKNITRYSNGI